MRGPDLGIRQLVRPDKELGFEAPARHGSIEKTGKELRAHFSWQQADADYTEGSAAR